VRDWTEGAGFSIAYFVFFVCTTITLEWITWNNNTLYSDYQRTSTN
jgi:hypothetical protein